MRTKLCSPNLMNKHVSGPVKAEVGGAAGVDVGAEVEIGGLKMEDNTACRVYRG
jgi:hypothetical protein